ncbi:MAG: large conductance mechanosensitive channel [Paracoccaceae bacterium]|jgi:large conductance mechanosensitive channel
MLQEFKEFIARGNVVDMAVGIIIGAAFTGIVKSVVGDLINPTIALFTGGFDFSDWYYVLGGEKFETVAAAREAGDSVFAFGAFIMAVINFFIVAFVLFTLVRFVNKVRSAAKKKEKEIAVIEEAAAGPTEVELLGEILVALKAKA